MGFFSTLFGGGSNKSTSGLSAMPGWASDAFKTLVDQGTQQLTGAQGKNAFTPLGQTQQESQAFNLMQLPTNSTALQGLIAQYMNPFQDYITQGINKQAEGNYSSYKDALSSAGQMGSNREFLNAGAADQARLSAIGSALAGNYNNAQQTALNQNQQNIQNLLSQGAMKRDLALQTGQAGVNALSKFAALLGILPTSSTAKGNTSTGIFS